MQPIRRVAPEILAGALCVLLATLAVLQYRWIGQVDGAAYERLARAARNSAQQLRVELDRELARAFLSLQFDDALPSDSSVYSLYSERFATWQRTAQHPDLVAAVYRVEMASSNDPGSASEPVIERWDSTAGALVPVDWSDTPLQRSRNQVARALRDGSSEAGASFDGDGIVITGPLRVSTSGFGEEAPLPGLTVLALDAEYVRQVWLPELIERHFAMGSSDVYRVAVLSADRGREVLYRTDAAAPLVEGQADVVERLFSRERVESYLVDEWVGGVLDLLPSGISALNWELLAAHESGSLAAAAAPARVWNLVTSFGVLLLLGGSVGLLIHASRLDQRHARQQLDLVAGVSHELRTPVSVIQAAADNLGRGVVEGTRVKIYGTTIAEQARRLGAMVEGALDFARIESRRGHGVTGHVAPTAIIDRALAALAPSLPTNVVLERVDEPGLPEVNGDEEALVTAVQNLVRNAVTYGGADHWVGVRCRAGGSLRRPEVQIQVEDRGPGIDLADRERIFEPFQRGGAAAGLRPEGSGLGLALVRRIAEAHAGRVSLATTPGSGSTFTLHLPAASVSAGH
jgi:signal transduction histidine kinase